MDMVFLTWIVHKHGLRLALKMYILNQLISHNISWDGMKMTRILLHVVFLVYQLNFLTEDIGYPIFCIKTLERYGYTLKTAKPPSDSMFPDIPLTTSDVVRYKEGALKGCGQAALAVANYFKTAVDAEEAEYWYRIGAQNGNSECMEQYGNILLEKEDILDQERGKF